jgi:LuxR family transcriptional regulator, maltose regulon positive regulatory protein
VAARGVRMVVPSSSEDALRRGVPGQPFATVRRARLEDALDRSAPHALTTVTGPAGSGKTVLLAGWAAASGAGWLSLRPEHVDVARLWRDIADALKEVGVELASRPRPAAALPEAATRDLREALDRAGEPVVVVLDDLHVLRGAALLLIGAIVADCGDALHLVVASRSDPDLPLGRMRVEGRLGELRATDLAFTRPEADALLAEHGLSLRPDQTERLVDRTEGWAAGLRLAALSLQNEDDPDRFLAEFTGDDHAVADYLSGEVLAIQSPETRRFLLRTSVTEQISGELADVLTEDGDGALRLAELHRAGVFLSPVDRNERWFRYHPMFAELLRARLRLESPGLWSDLHARAAGWLAGHGRGREALPHVVEAGETPGMVDVLAEQWLDLLLGGQAPEAVVAAARLPAADRRLAVAAAGACLGAGDTGRAEALLAGVDGGPDDDVAALAALLRARARSDVAGARRAATLFVGREGDGARGAVPVDDARRSLAFLHLGVTEFAVGDWQAAADALDAASALAVDGRRDRVLLECHGRTAALELLAGRLTRAEQAAAAARALAAPAGWQRTAAGAWAGAAQATVHWLRDELPEAEACADAATVAAYAAAEVSAAHAIRALRGHLAVARGDTDRGRALLRAVYDGLPVTGPIVQAWLDALGPCAWDSDAGEDPADPLAVAAVRLAHGDALSADRRAQAVLDEAPAPHPTRRLHALLVAAVARQSLGQPRDASEAVERALEIAVADGYRRPFTEGGAAVRRLLQRHATLPTAYAPLVAELVDALEPVASPPPGLLEPLSDRERDVLRLLPTLLPNTEIAGELFVSVNTVKTHVKSIYRKLDVSSRREAVARARQLRLI